MNLFNSLGSNYDLRFVLKALFAGNTESNKSKLVKFLEQKYSGKTLLLYKGRQAIELALKILDLPKNSVVAINGFTCFAVYKAIKNADYEPICLDLEQDLNFSANELSRAIKQNPKIKAVIVQNTLGYPCDIEKIAKICRQNNLILIEDLAHSVGTKYPPATQAELAKALRAGKNGKEAGSPREAGTVGDLVIMSFSQDKIIDAVSGGALIIKDKSPRTVAALSKVEGHDSSEVDSKQQLIDRLYPLFTFIIRKTYQIGAGKLIHFILKKLDFLSKPMNESFYERYDLPSWEAGLVLDNFKGLNKNLEHRRKIGYIYNSMLSKKITSSFVNQNIGLSSNLRYPIFVDNRITLINYLKKEGIYVSDIWYDSVDENLSNAKIVSNKILNLPTHKNVSKEDAKNIAQKINQWLKLQ